MHLESLTLTNFRCFGPTPVRIELAPDLTAFVGVNGSGKTAVMQSLLRLFGVTPEQRRMRRQDFHVPAAETTSPAQRNLIIEAVFSFPELKEEEAEHDAVPTFFRQSACDEGGNLKCRLRLEARLEEDGSSDGLIEDKCYAIRALGEFQEADRQEIRLTERLSVQMIYVPASRDGSSQVSSFLRGRLWRAISWSPCVKETFVKSGDALNKSFLSEEAVSLVSSAVERRWQEVHTAGTDSRPIFQPVDARFEHFIRNVAVVFHPDESGRDRPLEELSDGQRSLFHLAMTAAALDVEGRIADGSAAAAFTAAGPSLPVLTLIAVEEPENNLAPFYLSRIVEQIQNLTAGGRAQAFVSSHSASILSRVEPRQVRHFRLKDGERVAQVAPITLPSGVEEESKFVREAVRIYPELYFARFVVLGEGASEEVVLPRLANAMGIPIDRSFVAVVPLGGRHVNHLWKLLNDLGIPHATLLDLDLGREGGGFGRIKTVLEQLLAVGWTPEQVFGSTLDPAGPAENLKRIAGNSPGNRTVMDGWIKYLRGFGVFFSAPLDLDYSMLKAFLAAYTVLEAGRLGPGKGDPRQTVIGDGGDGTLYGTAEDEPLRWYRYLFLGRGKPSTHVRVLAPMKDQDLRDNMPKELRALLEHLKDKLRLGPPDGGT